MPLKLHSCVLIVCVICLSCDPHEHEVAPHGPFKNISSNGFVSFKFIQGVENHIVSTSMMDNSYSVSGGTLSINSAGGTMTIAVRNITSLWCNGCSLESTEPLVMDTLNVYMHAGGMDMTDLRINNLIYIHADNTGTYRLSGSAPFLYVATTNLATYRGFNFVTDSTYVNTTSVGDALINTTQVLNVFINSIGGVQYKGDPPIVRATITGMGQLTKAD